MVIGWGQVVLGAGGVGRSPGGVGCSAEDGLRAELGLVTAGALGEECGGGTGLRCGESEGGVVGGERGRADQPDGVVGVAGEQGVDEAVAESLAAVGVIDGEAAQHPVTVFVSQPDDADDRVGSGGHERVVAGCDDAMVAAAGQAGLGGCEVGWGGGPDGHSGRKGGRGRVVRHAVGRGLVARVRRVARTGRVARAGHVRGV